ncbi:MAG: hypothetical protein HC855_06230 [Rhizobiales bacterium]|nr:hypothetical protein [Hyphomicrobiales bacterium]
MKWFLVALLTVLASLHSAAGDLSPQENLLRQAMTPTGKEFERALEPGAAIRAYIRSGHVRRKPDDAADYVDYRRLRKPATLFGHPLLVLEEEYMTQYIGCCVNPGIGLVIEVQGSTAALDAFLAANKCRRNWPSGPEDSLDKAGVKPKPDATYVSITCRQNDMRDAETQQ